jgi:hypothetical protein
LVFRNNDRWPYKWQAWKRLTAWIFAGHRFTAWIFAGYRFNVPILWELGRSIIHYIIIIKPFIGYMDFCRASVYRAMFVGNGTINHSLNHQYQTFDWPHGFL